MLLMDAAKPGRRQILAEQRKKYGAYFPERLEKMLPPRSKKLDRRWRKAYHPPSFESPSRALKKRDTVAPSEDADAVVDSSTPSVLPPAPPSPGTDISNPPSLPSSPPPPSPVIADANLPMPSGIPTIDYGAAKTTPNPGSPANNQSLATAATSSDTDIGGFNTTATDRRETDTVGAAKPNSHRTVGIVVGVLFALATLVALGLFFRRYRQKLSASPTTKVRFRQKQHPLASFDGLKATSSNDSGKATIDDKVNSKETLLNQAASERAGPFDRAISTMFCTSPTSIGESPPRPVHEPGARGSLYKTHSKPMLHLKQSLESIVEVQEPKSGASSHFGRDTIYSFKQRHLSLERPRTSPGKTCVSCPPSAYRPFEEQGSRRLSPGRPQSAKGSAGEIEMTRQGDQLVIRKRSSNGGLRRPLSSAGSGFRTALRKTGLGGAGEGEGGPICIETDGIVEKQPRRNSVLSLGGVHDSPSFARGRELRSHFSCSTLSDQAQRASYAATVSPSGSFSFEIRDAVRTQAPVKLVPSDSSASASENKLRLGVQHADNALANASADSFLRDLDWDLTDSRLTGP